ncbi:MAG: SDR family oxidoreductase [Gammaproteobacteria bacterium]|nr:SDR family oxidoreductase [Gammaproteobacteria bacterium]
MDPAGKRAIVLGGTSGIGLATASQLQQAGATVIVMSRSEANAASAREVLGSEADIRQIDVLDRDALAASFEALAPFDILVNAATGGERATGPFLQMDLDGYQGSFRKLWGYVNSVRLGTPHMSERGCIVLVSGSPARKCPPGFAAISSVGNAVEGFCRAVATEIIPRRINVVSPGFIDTPMFPMQGEAREQFLAQATAGNLIKRPGTPDEVADGILFTIRNDFVTGTTVDVDGGALLP